MKNLVKHLVNNPVNSLVNNLVKNLVKNLVTNLVKHFVKPGEQINNEHSLKYWTKYIFVSTLLFTMFSARPFWSHMGIRR